MLGYECKGVSKMNEKKEYLNEEEYQKNNAKLKRVGKTILIIGVITIVVGFIIIILGLLGFGKSAFDGVTINDINSVQIANQAKGAFGGIGITALGALINSFGATLIIVGGVIMLISHRREIMAYSTQQVMPVAQEGIEKMTPTVADAVGSIAKSVAQGISEGKNEAQNKNEE